MKTLILLLLSFTAIADNNIELTGDLDITGTDQTAATAITYDLEGNAVQICIGLTLNGDNTGGGGGGGVNQGFQDNVANVVLSNADKTITNPTASNIGTFNRSVTSNTDGYRYAEFVIDAVSGSARIAIGVSLDSAAATWLGNNAGSVGLWNNSTIYKSGGSVGSNTAGVGDVVGVYAKLDGGVWKIWFSVNDVMVQGDPSAGTGEQTTVASGTLQVAGHVYGPTSQLTIRTTESEFTGSLRGASAWGSE